MINFFSIQNSNNLSDDINSELEKRNIDADAIVSIVFMPETARFVIFYKT